MNTENRNPNDNLQDEQTSTPSTDQVKNVGSESNQQGDRGMADLTSRPSEGAVGSTHSSGVNTKRSVTGSDFDGQVTSS